MPGSQVVLCTDGLANVGIGSLDVKSVEDKEFAQAWYANIGTQAAACGTNVSVISIKWSECALEDLGNCSSYYMNLF